MNKYDEMVIALQNQLRKLFHQISKQQFRICVNKIFPIEIYKPADILMQNMKMFMYTNTNQLGVYIHSLNVFLSNQLRINQLL